ncbi:hypothetical protein BVRB_021500 [Beta vulgaris subsp. vulgaris]|uniref:PUM-HD domain-containing protein n=1 Tax=Beta vulgaris subsp. vulgaris TaxID=3555 RepID=A0A0J8B094_BETVV|nr:hypothetical protein BVRB_021500 [Beta vulgaris subsp. vulgaris]
METLQTENEIGLFIDTLRPNVRHIVSNPSGHYVLLRCLDLFPYPASKFIFDAAIENVVEFSTDHYGLRVMKVLVQATRNASVDRLLEEVAANTLLLVENQYGNYVIQLVLSLENVSHELNDAIFSRMIGRFAKLSKQKFSSNVVEQCLRRGSPPNRAQVIKELIVAVNLLIRDRFGNYVLQTALECSTKPQTIQLGTAIAKNLHLLRDNVRAKWTGILRDKLGEHADLILSH